MDNHVHHTQTTLQSTCGSVCNYYPTKSCDNIDRSKSSDKQSTFNSHSAYTEDTKCPETATSFQIESKQEIIRTFSIEKFHNNKIKEMRKKHTLPAKTVFLKWWLDTSGCSKPLRSAWEDEEECMYRSAASSHTYSPTYFDGPGVSFPQSANEAYMFVSTRDPHLRNSVSGVSRLINLFPRTHKKHKTKTKSLRSHMNSPLSLHESVNQKVSLSQHFLDKDDTVYEKKCAETYQNQESEHKVNDILSCATRDVYDRNTSSNAVLPAHVSSAKTSGAGNRNHEDNVKKGQKESSKNNAALPHVQEVRNQQTSTPDIHKVNEYKYKQNSENNSSIRGNISNDNQSGNQQFSNNASTKDIMGPKSSSVNEPQHEELPVSDDPINIQTFVIPDNHPFIRDTEVSNGRPQKSKHEEPEYNQLLNKEAEGAIVTTNYDQDYNSPMIRTGPDGYIAGHVNSFLATEVGKSPPKSSDSMSEMKAGCLPGNICKPKSLSPNFYVRFGNLTHTELGKRRQLLSSKTNVMNNDDDNICTRSRGSYFSRLAEKRIGARESQMNGHEDASKAGKLLPNKHANTEDQSAPTSAYLISSNQSNKQSQLPLAVLRETLWNAGLHNHLVIHKHILSDDPRNKKIQTPSDGSNPLKQYLPQNSEILPFDEDNNFSNDNAGHINGSMMETDLENCSSHGVRSEYPQINDCRLNSGEDPDMERSTDKLIRNHNYAKFESEDENSSLDDEQNSVSSNVYSSEKSASVASRNSSSDLDESVTDYVKWSATSWSNTSLPPQHYSESEVFQIKYAASTTKIDEMRQKQIMQTAKLLILLLDKLPMKGCIWNDCLRENKRIIKDSTFKHAHGYRGRCVARSVSFHSHILSLLSKHYSFNTIKPSFKTDNEESVPQQTLERNRTTRSSKLKCMHANITPKDKLIYTHRKLFTKKTRSRLSFIDSLQKPKFQDTSYRLTKYVSKMSEQGCIKHSRKQKKNMCQFHQMFPKRKSTFGSQKVFCDISPLGSFKNMQFQSPDSGNQPTSKKSHSSNKISYRRQEKQERNKHKTDVNNSENIKNESYIKYGSFRVSKRINRERSRRLSDVHFLNAKPDHRKENMAAGTVFISKTNMLRGHKPHPPNASLEESQVKITLLSPPGLNPREPVYPKPKPYALGKKRYHKATTSKQICDLPDSSATQLPLGSLKRSFTSKFPWTKPHLKKLQASEIHDISTSVSVSSATMETTETRLFMKINKEACNSKTQKNVLPPLYHITSENIDTSSDKLSINNSKVPKSGLLVDQHKTVAPGQDNCQIKEDLSSLVPLDTMSKPQYDSKSASPQSSRRIHRQTVLTSLQNHGQLLSPLRRRFDCIKNKASSCVLKTLHSPNLRISCAPHYLCTNPARDNHDVEKVTTASPGVSVPNVDANNLQSLIAQNGTDEGNSWSNLEMHDLTPFVNKKNITSEKTDTCENSTAVKRVQNMHENNCVCTNKSPDTRICNESKVINNQDHDKKTSDTAQENNNSDTTNKKLNTIVPKSKCSSTSTFKFLTLLLSDELESNQS